MSGSSSANQYATIVSTAIVAEYLNDPDWRIFDCRHQLADVAYGERVYALGHLPGASFLHLDRDLSGPMNGHNGRHPLPDLERLATKLADAGISDRTQVVVYDDAGGMIAGRLWWLLRWMGHDRVALLDGGIKRWEAEGRPLTTDVPVRSRGDFVFRPERLRNWVVTAEQVLANIGQPEFCLIDARGPDRFRGENETIDPVGGHIPGARNRCFMHNLDANGLYRPAEDLRREFLEVLGEYTPEQCVMQCGSGVSACQNLVAMEIAGLPGARLYAGSWSEWCSDPARPVAR